MAGAFGTQETMRRWLRWRTVAATALMTGPDELTVRFDDPVLAITAGQAVVCYDATSDRLLGGGWIDTVSA